MSKVTFSHTGITCNDMARIERYYCTHFGFQRARVLAHEDGHIVFLRNAAGVYLELFAARAESPVGPAPASGHPFAGLRHLAFEVKDVDAKIAQMGADAELSLGPLDLGDAVPGWKAAWLRDPEGNIVEISQGYQDQEDPPPLGG